MGRRAARLTGNIVWATTQYNIRISYMLGMLEIRRLRDEAERGLGRRFNIREFHDRVLEDGGLTLPMMSKKIGRWTARSSASAG